MNANRLRLVTVWVLLAIMLAAWTAQRPHVANALPIGYHDGANSDSTYGWACDADNFGVALTVHFYKEGGVFIGSTTANRLREVGVGNACGGYREHGFVFTFPSSLKDGRRHTIYAYAINLGGGTNPLLSLSPIAVDFPAIPAEVYFAQPPVDSSQVDFRVIPDYELPEIPKNEFLVRMAQMGRVADAASVSWNVGQYTGFAPASGADLALYQRGPNNNEGTTAVQIRDKTVGIWINSASVPFKRPIVPITPAVWVDRTTVIRPFAIPGSEIGFSFELQVPTARKGGGAEVYAVAYFLFEDETTGKEFWYGPQTFDLRPAFEEKVIRDLCTPGYTCKPIVASSFKPGNRFLHLGPASDLFQQMPWSGFRYFDFHIAESEFRTALTELNAAYPGHSSDPARYRMTLFCLDPEVYAPNDGDWGQIGLAVRNIRIVRYGPPSSGTPTVAPSPTISPTVTPTVIPSATISPTVAPSPSPTSPGSRRYDKVYLRGANAGSTSRWQVFFKTSTSDIYSEDKSVWVDFPKGGGWLEVIVNMSQNTKWQGTITGLRVDPFNANEYFGIDYVYVGDAARNYVRRWEFNGASSVSNPFFGWTLYGIGNTWTDGNLWGGRGTNGDPFFHINTSFDVAAGF